MRFLAYGALTSLLMICQPVQAAQEFYSANRTADTAYGLSINPARMDLAMLTRAEPMLPLGGATGGNHFAGTTKINCINCGNTSGPLEFSMPEQFGAMLSGTNCWLDGAGELKLDCDGRVVRFGSFGPQDNSTWGQLKSSLERQGERPASELIYNAVVATAMTEVTVNDICRTLTQLTAREPQNCNDGLARFGDELLIETSALAGTEGEFSVLLAGRGALLSGSGNYESHQIHISFGLRLDGQPRIALFNQTPLYTTFTGLDRILASGSPADVKYINRTDNAGRLAGFQDRIVLLLRGMMEEATPYAMLH